LQPSPSGVGSHQGLGMQRCQLLDRSGVPCPSCGMTTSFSWFARGNVAASFYVQPMGMLMALSAACCVWGGLYVAIRPAGVPAADGDLRPGVFGRPARFRDRGVGMEDLPAAPRAGWVGMRVVAGCASYHGFPARAWDTGMLGVA
jgi:hypothetical protein